MSGNGLVEEVVVKLGYSRNVWWKCAAVDMGEWKCGNEYDYFNGKF